MRFTVLASGRRAPGSATNEAFLIEDGWDDWFRWNTLYQLVYVDLDGQPHDIGGVKIGELDMPGDRRRPAIPNEFSHLPGDFFSLGQDVTFYVNLGELAGNAGADILRALRDVAYDADVWLSVRNESVTQRSLLRFITTTEVEGQYKRAAHGGARLTRYRFNYQVPAQGSDADPVDLDFVVEPESQPPTNIHVLIGRNGVGKTELLSKLTLATLDTTADPRSVGVLRVVEGAASTGSFANLVSLSFSAFDTFEPLSQSRVAASGVRYTYVGLKRVRRTADDKQLAPKSPVALATEFGKSVAECVQGPRLARWRRALEMLEADPIFQAADVAALAQTGTSDEELRERARDVFRRLSSGHKIVLLSITRLVESVEERSLVLLDEPEAHLHPPLLSAFVRALSDLLINRNGVAIMATHSPVVLQEVPRSCVWKMRRLGFQLAASHPDVETFGENVGVLTREVFGLEVTSSGFHRLLREAVAEYGSYDAVVEHFSGELGQEARALVQALILAPESRPSG
jgi:hypothetical protein